MTAIQARATHIDTSSSHVSFGRQLRSELIKLLSVRGTWWSVAIVAVLTVGIAVLVAANVPSGMGNPVMTIVSPVQFTMLLAGILGVISVTGEYSTGMIRSTLTAYPVRGSVLAAKATVLGAFLFVVSLVIFLMATLIVMPIFAGNGVSFDWADPSATILPLLAASAVMALFALLGVGVGFLLRSGAGAIAVTVGIIFVLPVILTLLSAFLPDLTWLMDIADYLPASLAPAAVMPGEPQSISASAAWLGLGAWSAAALAAGWAVLRTRDA